MNLSPAELGELLARRRGQVITMETEPGMLRVFIPGKVKSVQNLSKIHWKAQHGYAKAWRTRARSHFEHAAFKTGWPVPAATPKRVTLWATLAVDLDDDNLRVSLKNLRDGLIDAQMIHNDHRGSGHTFVYPPPLVKRGKRALYGVLVTVEVIDAAQA